MKTSPLPPINQDPAFAAAQSAAGTYTAAAAAARGNVRLTPLAQAEQIDAAWTAANTAISSAWLDLQNRRQARVADLEALVPVGPGVPANATQADATVIHGAFRDALDKARIAVGDMTSDSAILAMLAEAERFGDDILRRAALTASVDAGNIPLVTAWCSEVGLSAELAELLALRATLAGGGDLTDRLFQSQGFQLIAKPAESTQLPALTKAAAQAQTDATRAANPSKNWR